MTLRYTEKQMTKKTAATVPGPSLTAREHGRTPAPIGRFALRDPFIRGALAMSWRLALVVLVPIIGGYALDQQYHKTPWLTLAGLALALVGVFGVLSGVLMEARQTEAGMDTAAMPPVGGSQEQEKRDV